MIERFLNKRRQVAIWPAKDPMRILVLEYLIETFDLDMQYSERQVNDILNLWHTFADWALLRRDFFDRGYFDRELNGTSDRCLKR